LALVLTAASWLAQAKLTFAEDILSLRKGRAVELLKLVSIVAISPNNPRFADEFTVKRPSIGRKA